LAPVVSNAIAGQLIWPCPRCNSGIDHALDLRGRFGIRLYANDLYAGRLRKRTVVHGAIGLGVNAAVIAHDDALALRARRRPDRRHRQRACGCAKQKPAA